MYSAAEKATGFATASATVSGVGWIANSTLLTSVGTLLTLAGVVGAWWMLRKEKMAEVQSRQETKKLLRGLAANQIQMAASQLTLTAMVERLIGDDKQESP